MKKFRHLDLFSGIGGFALAAQSVWGDAHEIAAFCEIDRFCRRILKKHWPDARFIEDIKKFDAKEFAGTIDILTGGFPCQPFSTAGKRRGKADDRYLWPEMLRIISQVRPRWIIGENVAGFVSMVESVGPAVLEGRTIDRGAESDIYEAVYSRQEHMLIEYVCKDLENQGYSVQPLVIPACGVDAPHKRDRVWIVGHADGRDEQGGFHAGIFEKKTRSRQADIPCGTSQGAASDNEDRKPQQQEFDPDTWRCPSASRRGPGTGAVCRTDGRNTSERGQKPRRDTILLPSPVADTVCKSEDGERRQAISEPDRRQPRMEPCCGSNGCPGRNTPSPLAHAEGFTIGSGLCEGSTPVGRGRSCYSGCKDHVADTACKRLQGLGSCGKQESGVYGEKIVSLCHGGDFCQWPAEPRVGRVAHGIPNRVDRLKGLGNAIVPQVAAMLMQAIRQIDNQ